MSAIDGVDLDFGPDDWVATAEAPDDFDGDGTVESLRDELAGLVGREVTLLVRFDDDGDDIVISCTEQTEEGAVGGRGRTRSRCGSNFLFSARTSPCSTVGGSLELAAANAGSL